MIALRLVLIAILTVFFQALTAPYYELAGVRPDFVLVVLAVYALEAPGPATWIATVCAGVLFDLLSIAPFGCHLVAMIVVVLVVQQGSGRAHGIRGGSGDAVLHGVVLLTVGIVVGLTIRPLLLWLLSGRQPPATHLPFVALYTLIFALTALPVLRRFVIAPTLPRRGDFRGRSGRQRSKWGGRFS